MVNRRKYLDIVEAGNVNRQDCKYFGNRKRSSLAFSLHKLLITILLLIKSEGQSSCFDNYMRKNVAHFVQIAAFLDSNYLLIHMAAHVIDEHTLCIFRQLCWTTLHLPVRVFDMLMYFIEKRNVAIQGRGFDETTLLLSEIFKTPSHAVLRDRRSRLLAYEVFWAGQISHQCCFCLQDLRVKQLHKFGEGVDLMECCLALTCAECLNNFLRGAYPCPHYSKPCLKIWECFQLDDPYRARTFITRFCPMCRGGFTRGLFTWDFTFKQDRSYIRECREKRAFNEVEFLGQKRFTYLSLFLRNLIRTKYFRDHLSLSPFYDQPWRS